MKKKSFRMVVVYKAIPKVFLKWTKLIFVDFKKEVKINQLPLVRYLREKLSLFPKFFTIASHVHFYQSDKSHH